MSPFLMTRDDSAALIPRCRSLIGKSATLWFVHGGSLAGTVRAVGSLVVVEAEGQAWSVRLSTIGAVAAGDDG